MSEARLIELKPIADRVGQPTFVLIAADDPEGMVRHTHECRQRGYPFIADPSQQLAFSDGALIRDLIDGATYLFSNEYESHMIESKTGWSAEEILERVGTQVTTLGADGVRITARDAETIEVKAATGVTAVEPTGVGDAFRAGFLAGLEWGFGHERAAQIGCVLAAYVVETVGTQEYSFTHEQFVERVRGSYGDAAADEVATQVRCALTARGVRRSAGRRPRRSPPRRTPGRSSGTTRPRRRVRPRRSRPPRAARRPPRRTRAGPAR
jgi:adenosine kinase